jgi:hypothetical protein
VSGKHAIIGLTRSAALEAAGSGARVNAVAPGYVETAMCTRVAGSDETKKVLEATVPQGRAGTPEETAGTVVYMAGDGSSCLTGQVIFPDAAASVHALPACFLSPVQFQTRLTVTAGVSDLVRAAVDEDLAAGHETALLGGEEQYDAGGLPGTAHPAEQDGASQRLLQLGGTRRVGGEAVDPGGVHRAGAHGVDANAPVLQLVGPGAGERADGRLRRGVEAERLGTGGVGDRGGQDDRGAVAEEGERLLRISLDFRSSS